jgi:glutathione S-transferase
MKLYYVVGSPNCRKVMTVANHLGLSLEVEYKDFFTGELRQPDYLAIGPNGMVPALRDGELTLWESNAIMQYLAATAEPNSLLPKVEQARADILRWQCWELAHYNKALGQLTFETVAKPNFLKMDPDKAVVEIATRDLRRFAPVLESHLQGRRYIVGDAITLADYSLMYLESFKDLAPFDWQPFPNINSYYALMRDNEHWRKTAPQSPAAVGRRP